MGWNAQDIEKLRNGQNKRTAAHTAATAQTAAPRSAAQTISNARGWTADDIAALRSGTGTKKTTEAWENRSAGAGTRLSGTGSLSGQVLAQMMGSTGSTNPKLQLAVPQTKQSAQAYPGKNGIVTGQSAAQTTPLRGGTAQPEWLTKAQPENRTTEKASAPAARVTGTVKPTEQQRIAGIARGEEGRYAQTAQKVKQYTEDLKATDDFSDFDRLNQWMDADPRHRKLVSLMRAGMGGQSYAERNNAMQPRSVSGAAASTAVPEKSAGGRGYTDAELLEKGYSRKEISEARQYIEDFDALPGWQRAARRTANTIGGIGDTVASSVFLAGETGVQSVKNAAATSGNWKKLQQSVQDDDRQKTLLNLMTGGKTRYAEQDHSMPLAGSSQSGNDSNAYTDAELMAKGYTRQEIYNMRARIAGTEVKDSVDPEKSLGYQLYKRGQDLTAAAQAGLSPIAKQALGIVSSAGENLAVAGINPAAVLPVLSAQGGAEAMGQSIEKGESAGKTLAGGLAKFGAGWAINSVGAADLAKTMGSDYAKDTLAGKLADVVRSVAADGRLAQQYPAIANTISGGVDNAMQAFVETYADKAIDAALGDSEAAESMFTKETFLNAVESGLAGGASGALGGAVGTGLGKMSAALNAAAGGRTAAAEDAAQKAVRDELRAQEPGSELLQPPAGSSSLKEGTMGTEREAASTSLSPLQSGDAGAATERSRGESFSQRNEPVAEQTAVNDDPAVHTPAQNASIAEYKDSVDPKMAEYVDKVRAGEELPPYMVTETSDRMRSAMMELTGLDKVGSVTMLDKNGVQHITNRHGGGDGSADGTMKESADVARAAYVLNNFDNAYLSNRKAEGYFNSKGKRASIVIFEKKIDGSHVVVEAVCDTKKDTNYIVTEYLAKNGVDAKGIAKGLRSPMNAVDDPEAHVRNVVVDPSAMTDLSQSPMDAAESDPRHTSETLAASSSAEATVTQQAGEVNGNAVENAGESVESRETAQPGGMRETYGLTQQSLTAKQREVQQELTRWKISDGASETISRNMPAEIGDAERYAAAASSLYRLGQMEDVTTFDKAMELAQGMRGLAVNTDYVLAQDGGRQALNLAWLQGHGELEAGKAQLGSLGGSLTKESISGSGRVLYKGTVRTANEVGTQLIELNAKATSTDAVMKAVLQGNDRVKAYVDTETGRIFFSDRAEDVFGTILHEDYHWYNSLDAEGAQALQQHALEYLAKSEGFEGIDEMIRGKLTDYAQQGLSYEEAAEELVADAWRGIFSDEASFKRWVEFQRGQAEKNAGKAGTVRKVMTKVKEMLTDIISRAKEVLAKDPENKAALKAQRLAEAEKRALKDEYFAHAEKAMDNLRAAKENAAALENKGAAKEKRYEINPEYADDVDQWDKDGRNSNRTFILGRTGDALQSLGARENDIYMKADKINTILKEHPEMTLEEIKRIPEILDDPVMILTSQNKGRTKQNTRLVMFGDVKAQDGRPVLCVLDLRPVENHIVISDMQKVTSAYTKDVNPVEFVRKSDVLYVDEKKERTTELFRTLGFKIPSELQLSGSIGRITYGNQDVKLSGVKFTELVNIAKTKIEPSGGTHVESEDSRSRLPDGSKESIAQEAAENKENDGTLKKNVRYQLSEADELTKLRDEQQRLDEQRRELKEERSAWLGSDAVKEIEAKKKALGIFSAEAKAYRDSEEYQNYLAKRKDYNARMAQLEDQSAVLNGRIKEAGARMQQQNAEKGKAEQAVYDAKAEAHGGKAEYRRVLAKERFGTTEDFRRAGYILPDGQMLDFAQNDRTRDTDHREIMSVFGSAEVKNGTEALNEFLLDGNVRVMAEAPGVDLSADTAPTTQQLEQIWRMVQELGGEKRQFTLDISTADGRVAAGKEYSGRVDADRVVREIREYYQTGELAQESDLAKFRYQLAEQADRDAKRNDQQTASRTIADKAAALDTLSQFFGLTRGVKVSRTAIEGLASRWAKANGSKVDRAKLARETEVLVEYLKADGADMNKAEALAETLAGEVLDGATYRNSELWDEYPELHKLEYTVNKTGQAKAELVKAYGSWSEAVAEARKHGVCLRQADGVQDGNPAEQYESVINDYRAVGGISDGAKALWKAAAQQAGVDGAGSMESTEWLSVLMNLHDAIKPVTMSRFADDAEYEDVKVELAGRMIGDILNTPEMTDAQAIFEGIQQHSLQMAKAAAGSEERAAEVEKGLKGVQKVQQREFGRRLAENRRAANRSTELQQMTELQRQNAKAEKLLDENLETLGADITNMGDLNEKLTFLRESYEREMKQEVKRMKAERQEMLDEAKLEMQKLRSEKNELAWQLKQEQRRADKAEYSLIVQENEIMEWEADNERKRAAFEQKQAQRNAIAIETARQQRDEDIAAAKAVAEKRVQRARDARKMDELKRGIRQNAAQLNQMLLRPSKDKHVPQSLISAAADVAKMADAVILNDRAVNRLTALQDSITAQMGKEGSPTAMTEEWKQTKVPELIQTLRDDLTAAKRERLAHLEQQLAEAKELPDSEKAWALQERIQKRIRETENRTYLPMTVDQMRMLKAITSSTLHVIRNANKTVSLAKAEEVDKIAGAAAEEVRQSKGNHPGGVLDGVHNFMTKYQLDMLGGERVFRMLGGYAKDGQMEKMAKMLNDGQYQQTKITIEGEKMFAEVTGKEHVKEMEKFSGSGADTVDIGLRDTKNNEVPLTHAQLCSLYMHLHNKDSIEHLMTGGFVIPNAKYYSKGDIEQAYQKGQAVHLGMLKNADGTPTADSILQTVEAAMTDYDRAWCRIMKEFFGSYTAKLINETSLQLVGYQRATEKNYYPIAVDKSALATQIEGLNLDATIEGRGFLKNRVKSSQPILLEECSNVVQRSLRDTAAYAGLAAPIRDVQKILNSGVETEDGLTNLKNGLIKQQWGKDAVSYIDDLLTDLQTTQRKRPSTFNKVLGNLRGNYAGAVLTLNPGVAIAQAASLPTAAAVLGGDTMAAVVPFVKNASPKQRAALEAEIKEHGDVLLDWRKRGSQNGELASIGKQKTFAEKGMDKLPNWLTGWINGMDEVTVAALWEGSKRYVQNHTAEFEGAEMTGSPAYWEAVNRTYQKVIEQTQPNYTVMQRAGIQRNPNELLKQLTMFTTQRFQNYGILADAVGDYKAQAERYQQNQSAENKAEKQRAGKQLRRAAVSQVAQTAVFAVMKIGADFLLHRWDREQDENGDVTVKSMWNRFRSLFTESFAGNFLYGSEIYSLIDNAMNGKDYDVLSAASISVVNDLAGDAQKFFAEFRKDTSDMDEEKLQQHHEKLIKRFMNLLEDSFEVAGVPYGNGRKIVEAVQGYVNDIENITHGGKFSFNSVPQSATGQYDRLYNAYRNKDVDEARAATEKLAEMGKDGEIYKQLKTRLKKYDPNIQKAAEAQVNGDEVQRYQLETKTIEQIYEVMGIRKNVKEDAQKREAVIDCVTGAVNAMADEQLKGDGGSVTDDLVEALDSGRAQDVQQELNRLMTAGKDAKNLKSKITEVCKPEYLAGSGTDKQQMKEMLLGLTDAEGNALYTEKTFDTWTRNAEKAAEKEDVTADPYAALK